MSENRLDVLAYGILTLCLTIFAAVMTIHPA